jgi:hypothetical protein
MALTVGEMADLVRREDVDRIAVVERLRVFTADGLLDTVGGASPGTGRARSYDDSTAYLAGILNTLADFGLPVRKATYASYLMMVREFAEVARETWAQGRRVPALHLEVADFGEPDPFGRRYFVFLHEGRKKGHAGNLIHPRAVSAHVVNLSRLFKRIDDRKAALAKAASEREAEAAVATAAVARPDPTGLAVAVPPAPKTIRRGKPHGDRSRKSRGGGGGG